MTETDDHLAAVVAAFAEVLSVEDDIRVVQMELEECEKRVTPILQNGRLRLTDAWNKLAELMAETGEVELLLPLDDRTDYKVEWTKTRQSVKVADPDAVPDGFVRLERVPKLKEIGDHLRACDERGEAPPNWACLHRGEPKLQWKTVKHKVR